MHLSIPGINLTPEYLNAYCECRINSGLKIMTSMIAELLKITGLLFLSNNITPLFI